MKLRTLALGSAGLALAALATPVMAHTHAMQSSKDQASDSQENMQTAQLNQQQLANPGETSQSTQGSQPTSYSSTANPGMGNSPDAMNANAANGNDSTSNPNMNDSTNNGAMSNQSPGTNGAPH